MSILSRVVTAITPWDRERARMEARAKARAAAKSGDWLFVVLQHHLLIETAFAAVRLTRDAPSRMDAHWKLGIVLTGHAIAEESVLYPALVHSDRRQHADLAYVEHAAAKTQWAELEALTLMSQEYLDTLERIRAAVVQHMAEEEGTWFLELKQKVPVPQQARLAHRYLDEFERYVGPDVRNFESSRSRAAARAGGGDPLPYGLHA